MNIVVSHLEKDANLLAAYSIREQVFYGEDGIPKGAIFDGRDATAEQFMAYDEELAIGTARYRLLGDGSGKVERVAVMSEYRGQGVGTAIMESIHHFARNQDIARLALTSKVSSVGLYLKLGYHTVGKEFKDFNIPHIKMFIELKSE